MAERFKRNAINLHKLHKSSAKNQKKLLNLASKDLIGALCDCACNIRKGKVPLTTKQFQKLKKYHKQLKALGTKVSQKKKKQVLQTGGFLGALLGPIAQVLLGGLFSKN